MNRGFLGGTFDPLHLGHLSLAQEALEKYSLEQVCFVPSRCPPHKDPGDITPFEHRSRMLRLGIAGNPAFQVADIEERSFPSYTVDMLERISSPDYRPCFIIGMDSLREIHTWKEPLRILELARVLVGTRPDWDVSSVAPKFLDNVEVFHFPGVWTSSSDIRARVRKGRSISYLVPEPVESYIRSRGLYGAEKGD